MQDGGGVDEWQHRFLKYLWGDGRDIVREGGEEGGSTTPPKEMKLAQDKRAFLTRMVW